MIPPGADTVIVRHGELGTKSSQVQHWMERLLGQNIDEMLSRRDIEATIDVQHGRIFIRSEGDDIAAVTDVATQTMGVISASPSLEVPSTMDGITNALGDIARNLSETGSFAVRARRAGNPSAHPFTSQDIERLGGSAIWTVFAEETEPEVDLDDPDLTFFVECRENRAFVFLEKRPGPGGFPYGSQGRVIGLISGGIDSPVATWEMMRRGCEVVALYFDFEAYGGPDHIARAVESVRTLARYTPTGSIELHRVPIGDVSHLLIEKTQATRMLSLRRFMFAVGEALADRVEAHALVTGESLGQKSSQTGTNLSITGAHLRYPIHRPLLAMDKQEIIDQAKSLGTFQDATINAGCNRVAPSLPATGATLAEVLADEPPGMLRQVDDALSKRSVSTVHANPRQASNIQTKSQV